MNVKTSVGALSSHLMQFERELPVAVLEIVKMPDGQRRERALEIHDFSLQLATETRPERLLLYVVEQEGDAR